MSSSTPGSATSTRSRTREGSIIPVTDDCTRYENGTQTVRVADVSHLKGASASVFPLGIREQIDTGYFRYIAAVRDRRIVAVDEARGLVLMIVVFDHPARKRTVEMRGVGEVELPPYHQVPNSVLIAELFKVRSGSSSTSRPCWSSPRTGCGPDGRRSG